jgi:integrase
MASVVYRPLKDGTPRWRVEWREGGRGGRPRTPTFSAEKEAHRFNTLVKALGHVWPDDATLKKAGFGYLIEAGKDGRVTSAITLVAYATQFIDTLGVAANTRAGYHAYVRDHLAPYFGDTRLVDVQRAHLRGWQRNMVEVKRRAPKTVNNVRGLLIPMFAAACRRGEYGEPALLTYSPMDGLDAPKGYATPRAILRTADHAGIFLNAAYDLDPDFAEVTEVISGLALRWGEFIALKADACHLSGDAPVVVAARKAVRVTGQGWTIVPGAKTKAGAFRELPVPTLRVLNILSRRAAAAPAGGLLFPAEGGLLIPEVGNYWRDRWDPIVVEAMRRGIPYRMTIHGLRKTTLSHLAEGGVDPVTLGEYAGHASPVTTLRVYTEATGAGRHALTSKITTLHAQVG